MDPILTPLFISGLTGLGASAGFAATVGPILTSFVLAAGALILSFLFAPKPPKPDDGRVTIHQTIPPRAYGYGVARASGSIMFERTHPKGGGTVYMVQALISHRINQFREFYYNDDPLDVGPDGTGGGTPWGSYFQGWEVRGAFNIRDGRYDNAKCNLAYRYGLETETVYDFIIDKLGTYAADLYPSTNLGNGIASLAHEFRDSGADDQAKRFPFGLPQPSALLELALVYDPRESIANGGTQDIDDENTWVYSTNPVLAILHYLCFNEFGFQRRYGHAIAPVEDDWIAQADICDELVAVVGGGSHKRYELGGIATTENDPQAVLVLMLAACDGWLVHRGDGSVIMRVGKFAASGVTLEKDDISGFSYQRGIADEDVVNRLQVNFTSPSHQYAEVECDPWEDDADQLKRDKLRDTTYDLSWVQDYRRARRIAKREFKRLREPVRGSLDLKLSAINACYERFIYLGDTGIPGLENRYIENRAARFNLGADASIEDWSATLADEGVAPPVLDDTAGDGPYVPANVFAFLETFEPSSGVDAQRIVVQFDEPNPEIYNDFQYRIRWRIIDADPLTAGDQPGAWTDEMHREQPGVPAVDRFELKTGVVDTDQLLEVQISTVSSKDSVSDWSDAVDVYSSADIDLLTRANHKGLTDASGNALVEPPGF